MECLGKRGPLPPSPLAGASGRPGPRPDLNIRATPEALLLAMPILQHAPSSSAPPSAIDRSAADSPLSLGFYSRSQKQLTLSRYRLCRLPAES